MPFPGKCLNTCAKPRCDRAISPVCPRSGRGREIAEFYQSTTHVISIGHVADDGVNTLLANQRDQAGYAAVMQDGPSIR